MNNKLILEQITTFQDAIKLLDLNGNGVLPVVDKENILLGLITDGDIRKAILNNNLDLEHIINKNPYKLSVNSSKNQIVNFLKKVHRRHIPLIDDEGRLVKVFTLDELEYNLKPNWVVIMAGGLGTRLGELTKDTPKPMLQIAGKPMVEHIIDMFVSHGFTRFMLSVNYKSEVIKSYFGDGEKFGIEIKYLEEKKKLGTGGALSLIDIELTNPFFVTNGDVISTANFGDLLDYHLSSNAVATMCVRKDSYQIPYGVIELDNQNNLVSTVEKPVSSFFINSGIYVLNPDALNAIPKNTFYDLPSLFTEFVEEGHVVKTYEITDYWVDMGRPSDYESVLRKFNGTPQKA